MSDSQNINTHNPILGTAQNESLYGTDGNDLLDGLQGNDYLSGGLGSDIYILKSDSGKDEISEPHYSTDDDDIIRIASDISPDQVTIERVSSYDTLKISIQSSNTTWLVNNYLSRTADSKHSIENIVFSDGTAWSRDFVFKKLIEGTPGKDRIYGYDSDDTFDGKQGDDTFYGKGGSDRYIFGRESDNDRILEARNDTDSVDVVAFEADVSPEEVLAVRSSSSLILRIDGAGNELEISNYFSGTQESSSSIELIEFADGTVWNRTEVFTKVLTGTSGKDSIYGFDSDDTIDGLQGDDYLQGGKGSDTYIITSKSDNDRISESRDESAHQDIVRFADDITPNDVRVTRDVFGNLELNIPSAGNKVTIDGFFRYDVSSSNSVERVEFSDGTTWAREDIFQAQLSGTDGNDRITGYDTDDTLEGKGGNDSLKGGDGSDTYLLGQNSGKDRIYESTSGGDQDRILFASEVQQDDVTITRQGSHLSIQVTDGDTQAVVENFFATNSEGEHRNTIESIDFADGSTWDINTIKQKAFLNSFTSGNDSIYGYNSDDTFEATQGNDHMWGLGGSDTYHISRESGFDIIHEYSETKGTDTLVFSEGIAPEDITLYRTAGSDLYISIKDTNSKARLVDFFRELDKASIDVFQFSDGTTWDRNFMFAKMLTDSMTNENDYVYGYSSDDVLDGKTGNDALHGGKGSDTYIFDYGYGSDRVFEDSNDAESIDQLVLGDGITSEDITLSRQDSSLLVTINDTDSIQLYRYFDSGDVAQTDSVENIVFSDGTSWNREFVFEQVFAQATTDGDDIIYGYNSDDRIVGGQGNDKLYGGRGSDTYVVGNDSGHDYIYESINNNDQNRIVIDADITAEQLSFERIGNTSSLLITLNEELGSQVTVSNFFSYNSSRKGPIETIELANGSIIDKDWIFIDVLTGGDGNDTIRGYHNSDDIITGGAGNDILNGGYGSDTYVFAAGFGIDIIDDYSSSSDANKIFFEDGIAAEDIHLQRDDRDLIIQHQNSQITVDDYFYDSRLPIAEIEFADGTVWQQQEIQQQLTSAPAAEAVGTFDETSSSDALLG